MVIMSCNLFLFCPPPPSSIFKPPKYNLFLNGELLWRKEHVRLSKGKHYNAEVYPKISALVKLARKIDLYNERN